ncbi:unnamed protein product [Peniophora sp. CBMAI 1063]|nr:unnamed protein product [Peniophora sp. CBMAI 1063]
MSYAVPLRFARPMRLLPLRTALRAPQRRFASRRSASSASLQTGVTRDSSKEDEFGQLDEDGKLAAIEKALKVEHVWKRMGYDMWAEAAETLDVIVPRKIHFWRNLFTRFTIDVPTIRSNFLNACKNAMAMYHLGMDPVFFRSSHIRFAQWSPLTAPFQVFGARRTDSRAWLYEHKDAFVQLYKEMSSATVQGDSVVLRRVARDEMLKSLEATAAAYAKAAAPKERREWTMHSLKSAKVESIRTTPMMMSHKMPETGSRLLVHALVRIESEQSLRVTDHKRRPLPKGQWEPKRVVERVIFERRLWNTGRDGEWKAKDKVYEEE